MVPAVVSTSSLVSLLFQNYLACLDLAVVYSEGVFESKKSAAYQRRVALSSSDRSMVFVF